MPVRSVKGGYRCGTKGKVYRKKSKAARQCKAIYASGYKKAMTRTKGRRYT